MCTRRLVTEPNVPGKGTSAVVSNSCPWPYHQQDMIATIKKHRIIQISLVRTRHNRNVWCLDRSNQLRRQAGHSNRHLVMRISIHNCIRERAGSPTWISSIRIPETIYIHTHIYIHTYYLHLMLIGLSLSIFSVSVSLSLCSFIHFSVVWYCPAFFVSRDTICLSCFFHDPICMIVLHKDLVTRD